jgi:glycine/D-amino acid oxidase-like deaminating enzyme
VSDRETNEDRFSDVLEPNAVHDVLVVGAGLIGSSIAWLLSKAGCRVVLIDAGSFGGEASAAGAGMLAPGGEYGEPLASGSIRH